MVLMSNSDTSFLHTESINTNTNLVLTAKPQGHLTIVYLMFKLEFTMVCMEQD